MAEYIYEDGVAKFTVPDQPTVRQQLEYLGGATILPGPDKFLKLWDGAIVLIEKWECKLLPEIEEIDLDEMTNTQATEIILWVGMECRKHMNRLDNVPKNS